MNKCEFLQRVALVLGEVETRTLQSDPLCAYITADTILDLGIVSDKSVKPEELVNLPLVKTITKVRHESMLSYGLSNDKVKKSLEDAWVAYQAYAHTEAMLSRVPGYGHGV